MRVRQKKLRSKKPLAVLIVFSVLAVGSFLFISFKKGFSQIVIVNSKRSEVDDSLTSRFKNKKPINFLLLGYGGGDHAGAFLTDSIMIAGLNPENKTVHLISIPRDIWIRLPTDPDGGDHWKINAAYAVGNDDSGFPNKPEEYRGDSGGGNLVKFAVGQATGLKIDRFVAVDFKGFEEAVDALGGIDVEIETAFDDFEYPIEGRENDLCGRAVEELPDLEKEATISATKAFPCRFEHIRFDKGISHLNGNLALKFSRSRHSTNGGSDFGRAERQRNVLVAVKQKILSIGFLPKALPLIDGLKSHFKTDLSLDDLRLLITKSGEIGKYKITKLALTSDNFLTYSFSSDGQYILLPKEGMDRWEKVRNWIGQHLDTKAFITNPVIKIENGTAAAGLADLAASRLIKNNLTAAASPSSKGNVALTKITVFHDRIDEKILEGLKREFSVSQVITEDSDEQSYDIIITLGKDYAESQKNGGP